MEHGFIYLSGCDKNGALKKIKFIHTTKWLYDYKEKFLKRFMISAGFYNEIN